MQYSSDTSREISFMIALLIKDNNKNYMQYYTSKAVTIGSREENKLNVY